MAFKSCAGAAALLLAGCTTAGPNYQAPEAGISVAPSAQAPFLGAQHQGFVQDEPPEQWWRLYQQPELDLLIEQALAANTDLRAAEANLNRAAAILQVTAARRRLSTNLSGGGGLTRSASSADALPLVLGTDFGLGLGLPFDLSGKIKRAIETAQADVEAVAAARDEVRVAVVTATTRAYAQVCSANAEYAAAQRILTIQQNSLSATQRLAKGGRGTAFDVSRAQTAADQTAAKLPSFVAQRESALFLLAAIAGKTPRETPPAVAACAAPPQLQQDLPMGDGMSLLRRRPDIRAAERALAADTARIGVAMADMYPQVQLGGSLGLTGPVGSFGSGNAFRIGIGPLLSWSFPNRPVVRGQIAGAEAAVEARLAIFDGTVVEALREVETALSAYAAQKQENQALRQARDSAATAEQQAGRLYRFGRADFLQLLISQSSLAQAEASLSASDSALVQRQIDIFGALGGGWRQNADAP